MRFLYNFLLHLLFVTVFPFMAVSAPFSQKRKGTLLARLGFQEFFGRKRALYEDRPIWIHALSVGEVLSAVPLVERLRNSFPNRPLLFSATTRTGFTLACDHLKDVADGIFYFCYDLPFSVNRALKRTDPGMVVIVESDIWPNFMAALKKRGIPAVLVNARLSDRTFEGYRRFSWLMGPALRAFSCVCAQTGEDARRFAALGLPPQMVKVTGNIKFDHASPHISKEKKANFRRSLGIAADVPVVVAGSTHPGEEEIIARAFFAVGRSVPEAVLVVAPRDPGRAGVVAKVFGSAGARAVTLAELEKGAEPPFDVIVIDRIGLLKTVYAVADLAFIGGSLMEYRGHNPIEPAACGLPVLFGPHMEDFRDVSEMLLDSGGARMVKDAPELSKAMIELLEKDEISTRMGEAALRVVSENSGALDRVITVLAGTVKRSDAFFSRNTSGIASRLRILMAPFSIPYKAAAWLRRQLYVRGFATARKLPCPVISVGNITTGGTGKTPMTIHIAGMLRQRGFSPMVVSRGYRGKASGTGGIVSDGERKMMDAGEAGDEPFMIALSLRGVPVVVGKNRYRAAMQAIEELSPDVVVLDDGFQHFQLARDLDIVLLDSSQPLGNGFLLPAGPLREPVSSLAFADALVFTRADSMGGMEPEAGKMYDCFGEKPVFRTLHMPVVREWVRAGSRQEQACDPGEKIPSIGGRKVFLFSGIARNMEFAKSIVRLGAKPVGFLFFRDHHGYSRKDIVAISRKALAAKADIIATSMKDYVKIAGRFEFDLDLAVIDVKMVFDKEQAQVFEQFVVAGIADRSHGPNV